MIIDTGITIAYKCSVCGTFGFFGGSVFKLLRKKEYRFTCRCKKSSLILSSISSRGCEVKVPCISCGERHSFLLDRKSMLCGDVSVFTCPQTGMQICFIGSDGDVRSKVDNLEREMDELMNMFGYDSYFKNTSVMFDALNRIHDIAEQGNLFCNCGSSDIDLALLSDSIHLKCRKCSGNMVIYAATNQDLKNILLMQQIQLLNSMPGRFIFEK